MIWHPDGDQRDYYYSCDSWRRRRRSSRGRTNGSLSSPCSSSPLSHCLANTLFDPHEEWVVQSFFFYCLIILSDKIQIHWKWNSLIHHSRPSVWPRIGEDSSSIASLQGASKGSVWLLWILCCLSHSKSTYLRWPLRSPFSSYHSVNDTDLTRRLYEPV